MWEINESTESYRAGYWLSNLSQVIVIGLGNMAEISITILTRIFPIYTKKNTKCMQNHTERKVVFAHEIKLTVSDLFSLHSTKCILLDLRQKMVYICHLSTSVCNFSIWWQGNRPIRQVWHINMLIKYKPSPVYLISKNAAQPFNRTVTRFCKPPVKLFSTTQLLKSLESHAILMFFFFPSIMAILTAIKARVTLDHY